MDKYSIDKNILIKGIWESCGGSNSSNIPYCWKGMCQEIVDGLQGLQGHQVEVVEGHAVIWRDGYITPHFIQYDGHSFLCPHWNARR